MNGRKLSSRPHEVWRSRLTAVLLSTASAASALAADTVFIGGAPGGDRWDLDANWSAGAPVSASTRALLGNSFSLVASGSFAVSTLHGNRFLQVVGGEIELNAPGSTLGQLYLQGGRLTGPGSLTARSLDWEAGELAGPALTVTGNARLRGALQGGASRVELLGVSTAGQAALQFAGGGAAFIQRGSLTASGSLAFDVTDNAAWINTGVMTLKDGRLRTSGGTISQTGTLNIADSGHFVLDHNGADNMLSTGNWHIGKEATLSVVGVAAWHDFASGTVDNRGTLKVDAPQLGTVVAFGTTATLRGPGGLEVGRAAFISHNAETMQLGWVRLAGPEDPIEHGPGSITLAGGLTVDRLDWGHGNLEAGGPVTVNGDAKLHGWGWNASTSGDPAFNKLMRGTWNFHGDVTWDGAVPIIGDGTVNIAEGARFLDNNVYRPGFEELSARFVSATVNNDGTYLMAGGGVTGIARVNNRGTIRLVGGSELHLHGFRNHGRVEVLDSRAAINLEHLSVLEGVYLIRNGELAPYGNGPERLHHNRAELVLDGAGSRQSVFGPQLDNDGRLAALHGAVLQLGALRQLGELEIDGASGARLSGSFIQTGASARTWIDGWLAASGMHLEGGLFSAGLEGQTGHAELDVQQVSFISGVLLVDIRDRADFDTVSVDGQAQLGGALQLLFGEVPPAYGVYRFLSASGGVSGRFDSVDWELDPALYRVSVLYGANFVELGVSAVPEPASWLLTLFGGLVAVYRNRRSSRRR
ncbi:hypothetical protein AAW51_3207 [Caldimonas brevitalea]|uniref:PEP-CTERM protein-sorting domain-containing protein n=2 Tax=Caldimonas brevitalea TaxID=413882 RepID=A0A0G3BPI7_9BURK|nr:hypothetical protein AAW51_3207 [Caldimonas brevitalea]